MSAVLRPKVRPRSQGVSAGSSRTKVRRETRLQGQPLRLRTLLLPFELETEAAHDVALDAKADSPNKLSPSELSPSELSPAALPDPKPHSTSVSISKLLSRDMAQPVAGSALQAEQPAPLSAQQVLMAQLTREVQRIEVSGRKTNDSASASSKTFSTGCHAMDCCLPRGGYDPGTVVEYLQTSVASGATSLALTAAREALAKTDRFCVLVDWCQQFYPPAAAALGIDLKRIIIVRPQTLAERLWAIDQALRSPAIVAVIAEVEQMDDRAARRLQLAAERGGGIGLLVRRAGNRQHPSWAEVQWLVQPVAQASAHRQLKLELMRARGGPSGASVRVQINAVHGRVESAPAATAALARTLAQPRKAADGRQERSA